MKSIVCSKKAGAVNYGIFTVIFISIMALMVYAGLYGRQINNIMVHYDNAVINAVQSANLADKQMLANYGEVLYRTGADCDYTSDFEEACIAAYDIAKAQVISSVKENLNLDDGFGTQISQINRITFDDFVLYNVAGYDVYTVRIDEYGLYSVSEQTGQNGILTVPSGDTVSNSGIYVQMTIEFKNMTGTTTPMIIAEFVDLSV